ncbi:transposase, partial [Novosphingobium sp. PC22D]
MGKANFSDEFKRDAVAQITERGYRVTEERDILKTYGPPRPQGVYQRRH